MRSSLHFTLALASLALIAACENDGGGVRGPEGPLHPWAEQAKAEIPDALTLHSRVIARSCAPNGGVCHNAKEYPDLHTPGNFVTAVSRPCNMDLANEPENVFDGCEPEGDTLESGTFKTRLAWMGAEYYDEQTGNFGRPIRLAEPAPKEFDSADVRFKRNGDLLLSATDVLYVAEGATEGWLLNLYNLDYPSYLALQTVVGGDPNGNGVFGAEDGWAEITPGKPGKSYLWARVTGTVPGTRMPLANQAISNPEYVAIACWIETLGHHAQVTEEIDYDACWYARTPTDYEWVPE
jgi:hypothetical protein